MPENATANYANVNVSQLIYTAYLYYEAPKVMKNVVLVLKNVFSVKMYKSTQTSGYINRII